MDPDTCLARLVEALQHNDRTEAFFAADDLDRWLRKEGFMPHVDRGQLRALLGAIISSYSASRPKRLSLLRCPSCESNPDVDCICKGP